MTIRYVLISLQELLDVMKPADERAEHKDLPQCKGYLEVVKPPVSAAPGLPTTVVLKDDEAFEFTMNFKDFVIQASTIAGVPVRGQDAIPTWQ